MLGMKLSDNYVNTNAFMKWTQSKALLLCPHIMILLFV